MEKEKQLKEFDFHGLRLIGVYNPNFDSWWFRGKEVYRCLGVSKQMFSYYMKQVDDKHKKKLKSDKVNKIFQVKNFLTRRENDYDRVHMETLISESGLYMMASCFGKTKECEEFRKFVFEDLLVSLRKAEQETMKEKFDTLEEVNDTLEERVEYLEAQNAGLRAELAYWEKKRKQARACLTDNRKNQKAKENQDDWTCMYENY